MKVSLKWLKRYIDLEGLEPEKIAYDLTVRTVEVENVEKTYDKYHDIVVGKILEVKDHPNADKLKVCMTDIGEENPVQIVCGGINLYEGEFVVVSKPGSEVVWHGEGEPVKIKETKMRGVSSYGMICNCDEVYLSEFFPTDDEEVIVDLKGYDVTPGQNIADLIEMDDVIFEIDNKSLTNRPDLWGHYGIARELSAIYDRPLKPLEEIEIPKVKNYDVEIEEKDKCNRYIGVEIDGVDVKESPMWMKQSLVAAGMRPINLIVDITNYVMLAVGQPTHAFDKTHVTGEKIIVRNAKKGEKLLLLDDNDIKLDEDDLVICDTEGPIALAGIKGGKKDSILDTTKGIVLEVANFTASTIRKTDKKFNEKTDASIRYEKGIDTERCILGLNMALSLINELYKESKIISYTDNYPIKTERNKIEVKEEFLDVRLGKKLDKDTILKTLKNLEYDAEYKNGIYNVTAPVFRSTGDVSIKDDVMGDIARIIGYDSFEEKPLTISFTKAVRQNNYLLERRIKEYLAYRCNFNEIFTYPWIDIKYINAAGIDTSKEIKLATPPGETLENLRSSLIPGMLEKVVKNSKYFDNFRLFEIAQVFEEGEYHETTEEETLPIHKKYLTGCIVGKDPKEIFYELKGVLENISSYTHMEPIRFVKEEKPSWADPKGYLNILKGREEVGSLGLVSLKTLIDSGIKHVNVCMFEIDMNLLVPYPSRTNKYKKLPSFPLVEKDLSILVDNTITWENISKAIKPIVKELEFIDEYKGDQIPSGKKSVTLRFKIGNDNSTMTSEEISTKTKEIINKLEKKCNGVLREE